MASKTQIANLALFHCGSSKPVQNVDSDATTEAIAVRTFFETVRDNVLADFPWPFATKFISLALVSEDPTEEYEYAYRYPTDCVSFRRILSGTKNDTHQSRPHYRLAEDTSGTLIYCDIEDAEAEYTVRITNTERFSADFVWHSRS